VLDCVDALSTGDMTQHSFNRVFPGEPQINWYQNVSILDFIGTRVMEVVTTGTVRRAVQCSAVQCSASVKSSLPRNQHLSPYKLDAIPVAQPTVSKHWRENTLSRVAVRKQHLFCELHV